MRTKDSAFLYPDKRGLEIMKALWSADRPMTAADIGRAVNDSSIFNTLRTMETKGFIKAVKRTKSGKNTCRFFCPTASSEECALNQFRLYYIRQNSLCSLLADILRNIEEGRPDILYRINCLTDTYRYSAVDINSSSFYLNERECIVMKALWSSYEPMSASDITEAVGEKLPENTVYRLIRSLMAKNAVSVSGYAKMGKVYGRLFSPAVSSEEYAVSQFSLYYVREDRLPFILGTIAGIIAQGGFEILDKIRDLLEDFY